MAGKKSDHDLLVEMHTVLLGANGNEGLCKKVDRHSKSIGNLKLTIAIMAVLFVGGGGGGGYALASFLLSRMAGA